MAGTWPNLDAADLETRVRTYLNEVTADFYTQAEIWRWLSIAAKDIAQKSLCVRRILDAVTAASTRNVATNAYKVIHVEYIPSSGRPRMLTKIDPLRVGHYPMNGTMPQYWYEFGDNIGIEPLPDAVYKLRLYVADIPKMQIGTFPITSFAAWTAGTGWTAATATHTGAGSGTLTENTSLLAASTNYTITFTVSGVANSGIVTPSLGDTAGVACSSNGIHSQTITTSATASPKVIFTATNDAVVGSLYILKEADFAAVGDQTELPTMWQNLLAIYATYSGLNKDRKYGPMQMLESVYNSEISYLRQNVVEVIPDGRNFLKYQ
jgi:hypothetical protein